MSNMGYVRFQNTLRDLIDCDYHLGDTDELSDSEAKARLRLIKLCVNIADSYGCEVE
jgi:hypothetical protein